MRSRATWPEADCFVAVHLAFIAHFRPLQAFLLFPLVSGRHSEVVVRRTQSSMQKFLHLLEPRDRRLFIPFRGASNLRKCFSHFWLPIELIVTASYCQANGWSATNFQLMNSIIEFRGTLDFLWLLQQAELRLALVCDRAIKNVKRPFFGELCCERLIDFIRTRALDGCIQSPK